jgi:hypothetical protein
LINKKAYCYGIHWYIDVVRVFGNGILGFILPDRCIACLDGFGFAGYVPQFYRTERRELNSDLAYRIFYGVVIIRFYPVLVYYHQTVYSSVCRMKWYLSDFKMVISQIKE